jgi:predicted nucleic acid-binding Zn ribbon protein
VPARRRTQPRKISTALGQVLGDLGLDGATAAFRIAELWSEAVGADVAKHCRPVIVRAGVLEAEVDSSVWCQQLQMRRPELLAKLQATLGEDAPSDLRFRVGYTGQGSSEPRKMMPRRP